MKIAIAIIVLFALAAIYALWIRPWLQVKPWARGFFEAIEPFERTFFKKSETILLARAKVLVGLALTATIQLGGFNVADILPLVPDQYDSLVVKVFGFLPLAATLLGMADERLRNTTTLPLEIVSLPPAAVTPAVVEAVAVAKEAQQEAVAAVVEAKADVVAEAVVKADADKPVL